MFLLAVRRLAACGLVTLCATATAHAASPLRVSPPSGARFLIDQRFDIRVEGDTTATLAGVKLTIDEHRVPASRLVPDAYGNGLNVRNVGLDRPGRHTLRAVNAAGDEAASTFTVVDPFHGGGADFDVAEATGSESWRGEQPVRNIIILLGDGMGASHRTAARLMRYGMEGGHAKGLLAMDRMPGTGLVMTASLNSIVTDSAPGMANYVTGNKANNNQEGVFPDNTVKAAADLDSSKSFDNPRVEYLSEYLHRKRWKSLGIVTTADVEDATPAANAVHTADRNAGTGVADQYLDESFRSGLTVLLGGGRRWFVPKTDPSGYSSRSASTDYVLPAELSGAYGLAPGAVDPNRNLIGDFQAQGFRYVSSRTDLSALPTDTTRLLGLFAWGNMNVAYDKIAARRGTSSTVVDAYHAPDQPLLDEMTDAALKVLDRNPRGFVLMVEGAHIDKQSHLMDAERATWETIEFDRAIARALAFAKRDGHTLVLVTADHECSGFSILGASTKSVAELEALAPDSGLVAPGTSPVRQAAVGVYDTAGFPNYTIAPDGFPTAPLGDSFKPLQIGFGANADRFEDWLSKPLPVRDSLLPDAIKTELKNAGFPGDAIERTPEKDTGFFVRGQVSGTQAVHTASDIPLSSYSSGSDAWRDFVGVQDNTDVFFKMAKAALGRSER